MRRGNVVVLLVAALLALAGCDTYPADPEGTLDRVRGGTLRVGASANGDWVRITSTSGIRPDRVEGREAELIQQFADQVDAKVEWVQGTEQVLAEELKHGALDVVIGGLDDKTPWSTHAGMTRPYTESRDGRGNLRKHVMLVRLGENAFLLELDKFLLAAKESQ